MEVVQSEKTPEPKKDAIPGQRFQAFTAALMSLAGFFSGLGQGWSSHAVVLYLSEENSPTGSAWTESQFSWTLSFQLLGSIFMTFFNSPAVKKLGCKGASLTAAIVNAISWGLLIRPNSDFMVFLSRFLWGLATSAGNYSVMMYVAETSCQELKGPLASLLMPFINLGFSCSLFLGAAFSHKTYLWVCFINSLLYIITFALIPESHIFYLDRNNKAAALKVLLRFRGGDKKLCKKEIEDYSLVTNTQDLKKSFTLMFSKSYIRSVEICIGLVTFGICSGVGLLLNLAGRVFELGGSTANWPYVLLGIVKCSSFLAPVFVHYFSRKLLLYISYTALCLFFLVLGTYFKLLESDPSIADIYNWVPPVIITLALFTFSCGGFSIATCYTAEILHPNIRRDALSLIFMVSLLLMLLVLNVYIYLPQIPFFGYPSNFFLFAIVSAISLIFTWFRVPEIKKMSFDQVMEMLGGPVSNGSDDEKTKCPV